MWMEYRDLYWTPPALWEEGINGGFIDFNANMSATKEKGEPEEFIYQQMARRGSILVLGDYAETIMLIIKTSVAHTIHRKPINLILAAYMLLPH